jgi:hypothetical protein
MSSQRIPISARGPRTDSPAVNEKEMLAILRVKNIPSSQKVEIEDHLQRDRTGGMPVVQHAKMYW